MIRILNLIIIFFLISPISFGQKKTIIKLDKSDTTYLYEEVRNVSPEGDTICDKHIKFEHVSSDTIWFVYSDKQRTKLLLKQEIIGDTVIEDCYYTNQKQFYRQKSFFDGTLVSETYWYSNGQLFYKNDFNNLKKVHNVIYYKNGNIKFEGDKFDFMGQCGKQIGYYENGNIQFEHYFINCDEDIISSGNGSITLMKETGTWKDYSIDGLIVKEIKYPTNYSLDSLRDIAWKDSSVYYFHLNNISGYSYSMKEFRDSLYSKLKVPIDSSKIERYMKCNFIVEKDGKISNVIIRSDKFIKETLNAFEEVGYWKPVTINGRHIRVLCEIYFRY